MQGRSSFWAGTWEAGTEPPCLVAMLACGLSPLELPAKQDNPSALHQAVRARVQDGLCNNQMA